MDTDIKNVLTAAYKLSVAVKAAMGLLKEGVNPKASVKDIERFVKELDDAFTEFERRNG